MKKTSITLALAGLLSVNTVAAETTITLDEVSLSGIIELEASYSKPETGASSGDFVVATTEVGISADINSLITADIVMLYEEGDTPLEIDVSTLTISKGSDWYITAGQQYLPFGLYNTGMISDPITLEMGETRESALVIGTDQERLNASLFIFNGDEHESNNVGITLSYEEETAGFNLSYMDNLAESDGVTGLVLNKKVAGVISSGYFNLDNISLNAEYISSLEKYDASVLNFKGNDAEPASWNVELVLSTNKLNYALGYQASDEAVNLGLADRKLLAAASFDIAVNSRVMLEFAEQQDYSVADGGNGEKTSTVTAMLAVEF